MNQNVQVCWDEYTRISRRIDEAVGSASELSPNFLIQLDALQRKKREALNNYMTALNKAKGTEL